MTRVVCLVLLGFGILPLNGCGGSDDKGGSSTDPVAQCKEAAKSICAKFFGCYSKDELTLAAQIVGNNEADCVTKFNSSFMCTTEGVKCDSGQTYDAAAGNECISQIQSLSCNEFKSDSTATPAACDETCK
jgi:hypothetical protein